MAAAPVKITELAPLTTGFDPANDVFALVHAGWSYKVAPADMLASYLDSGTITIANLVVTGTMQMPNGYTGVTQPPDTANTTLATTGFVIGQAGTVAPVANGAPTAGVSARFARDNHVHPTDMTRAIPNSQAFTGEVAMPGGAIFARAVPDETFNLNFLLGLPAGVTFSRGAGVATYTDANGVMRIAATNSWLQSADANNAAWVKAGVGGPAAPVTTANQIEAPDGTLTAGRVVYPAVSVAASYSILRQSFTAAVAPYTFSMYLKGAVGGEVVYLCASPNGTLYYRQQCVLTTAWQRFSLTTPNLTAVGWFFELGTDLRDASQAATPAQTIFAWGGQVELGGTMSAYVPTAATANGAPRFDYHPVSHALRGLLLEEARTNLLAPSLPSASWSVQNVTLTPNFDIAPDGTNSAVRMANTTSTTFHGVQRAFTIIASQPYTVSVYAKAAEIRYLQIIFDSAPNPAGAWATFDLLAGVVSGAPTGGSGAVAINPFINYVGNGWYRIGFTSTMSTYTTGRFSLNNSNVPNYGFYSPTYAGAATDGVLIWGCQVEAGTFSTSHIPTTTAVLGRALETCVMPLGAWFNAAAGTLFAEISLPQVLTTGSNIEFVNMDQGSSADIMGLRQAGGQAAGQVSVWVANANVLSLAIAGNLAVGTNRLAFTYNRASLAVAGLANGGAIASGVATGLPTPTRMTFGSGRNTPINGYLRRVAYWGRVLADAELQAATIRPTSASGIAIDASTIGEAVPANGTFSRVRFGSTTGPTWTTGTALPLAAEPVGSVYSRVGGAVGATLYVSRGGGTWAAVAGV